VVACIVTRFHSGGAFCAGFAGGHCLGGGFRRRTLPNASALRRIEETGCCRAPGSGAVAPIVFFCLCGRLPHYEHHRDGLWSPALGLRDEQRVAAELRQQPALWPSLGVATLRKMPRQMLGLDRRRVTSIASMAADLKVYNAQWMLVDHSGEACHKI